MYAFEIGKVYTFQTHAPSVFGTEIRAARLMSIMDYETATLHEPVYVKYRSVYPLLPVGTPDAPESAVWYRFESESGERIIFADPWIQDSTVQIVEHVTIQLTVTRASVTDVEKIRQAIYGIGLTSFTMKTL